MKKVFLLLGFSTLLLSCEKEMDKETVFKGAEVSVHHGKAWSWIRLNNEGAPQQLAVSINDAALHSLPIGTSGGDHTHENNVIIPLHPAAATATPFKFIGSDWNPSGHDGPGGVYEKPHFDFHFYMVSEAEMQQAVDPAKLDMHPEAAYIPQNHVPGPAVPQMGKHWIDVTSPELKGQPFTETFIYGSYNGKINFYEPMITLDFLKKTSAYERSIPQPIKFEQAGYYPTRLRLVKRDGVTEIILDAFVYRQASKEN